MLGWTQSTTNPAEFTTQTELCTLTVLLRARGVAWKVEPAHIAQVLAQGHADTTNLAMIAAEQAARKWEVTTVAVKPQGDV